MAAREELTTVAAVKAVLGISDTSYDTLLESMLDRAESLLADWCGRRLTDGDDRWTTGEVVQKFAVEMPERVILANWPVGTINSVSIVTGFSTSYTFPSNIYRIDDDGRTLRFTRTSVAAWQLGVIQTPYTRFTYSGPSKETYPYVEVNYDGGYAADRQDVPPALAAAAIDVCKQMFLDRDRDYGLQSESLGNYSYTQGMDAAVIERVKSMYLGAYLPVSL